MIGLAVTGGSTIPSFQIGDKSGPEIPSGRRPEEYESDTEER